MFMFTIKLTGNMEDWGCGILHPDLVHQFDRFFIMKKGHTLDEIINDTFEAIPCSDEVTQKVIERFGIPDDWVS